MEADRVETRLYSEMQFFQTLNFSMIKLISLMETHITIQQKLFTLHIPSGACCVKKFLWQRILLPSDQILSNMQHLLQKKERHRITTIT